ncbi:hypothetical protein NDU88_007632 [Pleurodeles waltl]|uniref:Uncharacterized protein n=1 Tax=Pleurodeles waltl TaxID=8319 RepID=A0AAV7NU59_PLEWA|nr:hypothetical protein NDU88_007632 [Pleurodeles waltl]
MALAGAHLQGYSTGEPAPAGPDSKWAAPPQEGPGQRRFFRLSFPGLRSALAPPEKSAASHRSGSKRIQAPAPGQRVSGAAHPERTGPDTVFRQLRIRSFGRRCNPPAAPQAAYAPHKRGARATQTG